MYEKQRDNQLTPSALDLCPNCQGALLERDRFCRHCGTDLSECTSLLASVDLRSRQTTRALNGETSPYATAPLAELNARRPVSGPLVSLVTTELAPLNSNRFARRLTIVLISFPIWLVMILFSPFDAYAATKAIARQL